MSGRSNADPCELYRSLRNGESLPVTWAFFNLGGWYLIGSSPESDAKASSERSRACWLASAPLPEPPQGPERGGRSSGLGAGAALPDPRKGRRIVDAWAVDLGRKSGRYLRDLAAVAVHGKW